MPYSLGLREGLPDPATLTGLFTTDLTRTDSAVVLTTVLCTDFHKGPDGAFIEEILGNLQRILVHAS